MRTRILRVLLRMAACSVLTVAVTPVMAMPFYTINVTTKQDIEAVDELCSLREAVTVVNSAQFLETASGCFAFERLDGTEHLIKLLDETYTLESARLEITVLEGVKIQGPVEGAVVQGAGAGRLLHVDDGDDVNDAPVSLVNLTLKKGKGEQDLGDSDDKSAAGGIYSREALSLDNVTLTDNEADNSSALRQVGGTLSVVDSLIQGNESDRSKGAVYVEGASAVTIKGSVFYQNKNWSGAILEMAQVAQADIQNAAFVDNQITYDCFFTCLPFSDNLGTIGITDSSVTLFNSTVSGNEAALTGAAAIYARNSTLTIRHSTLYNNAIENKRSSNDARFEQWVGGLYLDEDVTATIANSVLAGNLGFSDTDGGANPTAYDCFGLSPLISEGFNYFGNVTGCDLVETMNSGADLYGNDPLLSALLGAQGSGSAEYFHRPQFASPLLDGATASSDACSEAELVDQRGVDRPQGNGCDIGSVEHRSPVLKEDIAVAKELEKAVFALLENDAITEAGVASIEFFGEFSYGSFEYDLDKDEFIYQPHEFVADLEADVTDSLSYRIVDLDGFTSNEAQVTVQLNKYVGPIFAPLPTFTVAGEEITSLNVIFGDQFLIGGDAELDYASFEIIVEPKNGMATCACFGLVGTSLGNLSYSPNDNFSGADSFTFQVSDRNGLVSEPVVVNLDVQPLPSEEEDDDGGSMSWLLLLLGVSWLLPRWRGRNA